MSTKAKPNASPTESESLVRLIAESLPALVAYADTEGRILFANSVAERWYNRNAEQITGCIVSEIFGDVSYENFRPCFEKVISGETVREELTATYPDGVTRNVEVAYEPHLGPEGDVIGFVALVVDISDRKRTEDALRESQTRLLDAIDTVPDGFVFYDHNDRLVLCNEKYRKIYPESADLLVPGARFEAIIRKGVARGQYADAVGCEEKWISERMEAHRNPKGPIEQRLPNGRWLRIEERKTEDGGIVGFRIDITELKRRELELERLASTDQLTGALNRRRFLECSEQEFGRADRYGGSTTVLLIDIDHFKRVNDVFGHAAGDEVLRRLVQAVRAELREQDTMCRFGGEEFAVLLPQTELAGARIASERLRRAVGELAVPYEGAQITITLSIGVAVREGLSESLDDVLARADKALYEAKHAGRNCVAFAPLHVAIAS